MDRNPSDTDRQPFDGRMFLYERPELLTQTEHGSLGLSAVPRPYDFVRAVRAVPLVWLEIQSAQKDFPVVFSDTETPAPMAMLGVIEDVNLFVDNAGNWAHQRYVPSYIRCHPIALASGSGDQMAVVIDRESQAISAEPEIPFFSGDKLSGRMQQRVDFCARHHAERQKTNAICARLKELDLFTGQQVTHRKQDGEEERQVGTYAAVDVEKLGKLDPEVLRELHGDGTLSGIYAHIFSLENWSRLLDRRRERRAASRQTSLQ